MFNFSHAASLSACAAIFALATAPPQVQAQVTTGSGHYNVTADSYSAANDYPSTTGFGVYNNGVYSQVQINSVGPSSSLQALQIAFFQVVTGASQTKGDFSTTLFSGSETGYNVSGLVPLFTQGETPATYSWDFAIQDLATKAFLYQNINGVETGSATGNLAAAGSYLLTADASMTTLTDPVLNYNPTIAFGAPASLAATPEPNSLLLLCTGMTGIVAGFRRRIA